MKFSVVNEQWDIDVAIATHAPTKMTTDATLELVDRYGVGIVYDDYVLFRQFKDAFENKFGEFEEKPLTIELNPMPMSKEVAEGDPAPARNLWSISIQSETLKEIQQVMHYGNPFMDLQFEFKLTCSAYNSAGRNYQVISMILAEDFQAQTDENGVISRKWYKDSVEIKIPPGNWFWRTWTVAVQVLGQHFVCVADMLPKCSDADRKIFTEKKLCDFEIVSGDGAVIPCHKMFLWAKSPVFAAMLEDNKFKEAVEGKMTIDDMSTRGVNALLEFLYCDDVPQALAYCDVALELLKASDKYDIPLLWKVVAKIMTAKSHTWYTVDVALQLASFLVNCPRRQESVTLDDSVVDVLTWKSKEFDNSTVYQQQFPSEESRRMFKLLLTAAEKLME